MDNKIEIHQNKNILGISIEYALKDPGIYRVKNISETFIIVNKNSDECVIYIEKSKFYNHITTETVENLKACDWRYDRWYGTLKLEITDEQVLN